MSTTDEIGSPNKLGKWLIILLIVVGLPGLLLSPWCLERLQQVVNDNAQKPWSADLQKYIAHAYAYTLRPDHAAQKYEYAANQYSRFENYDQAGWMLYSQGIELEESKDPAGKYKALEVYDRLSEQYKEYPVGAKAHAAAIRIKTYSRP